MIENIPIGQPLVVEHEGSVKAVVRVESPTHEPKLVMSISEPCPTCKQQWKQIYYLDGPVNILWPPHYISEGKALVTSRDDGEAPTSE